MARSGSRAVVLYDGDCGFCDWTVQFVLRRDRQDHFRFAAQQSRYARGILENLPAPLRAQDTVYLVMPGGAVLTRSAAVIYLLRHLRWPWSWCGVALQMVPRALRDRLYDWGARRRKSLVSQPSRCAVLSKQERSKFLDTL